MAWGLENMVGEMNLVSSSLDLTLIILLVVDLSGVVAVNSNQNQD